MTERVYDASVEVPMKPITRSIIALALVTSWTPCNLWAQESGAELLNQARVTKHQAKRIALARVKGGTIKRVELEKDNGVLIWSVDVTQSGKKDLTDVWVDATTGKITAINLETPTFEKGEVAEAKVKKWLSGRGKSP
jgi:hypothetical protein